VTEDVPGARGLNDGHVSAVDQLVERGGRFGVAGVGQDLAADLDAVAARAAGAMVELDRLVLVSPGGARWLRFLVCHLESIFHGQRPVLAPAHLPQGLHPLGEARGPDESYGSRVDEHAIENKGWQAERVIAVKVGQENRLNRPGIHAAAVHMRQKGRAAV